MRYANTFQYNETLRNVCYLDVFLGLINLDCFIKTSVEIKTAIEKKPEMAVITIRELVIPSVIGQIIKIDYINQSKLIQINKITSTINNHNQNKNE